MNTILRLTAKEWQNLRRPRLVGPKLAGIEVPCVECGTFFMRLRGQRKHCYDCGQRANWERQNARRSRRQVVETEEAATEEWIKDEVRYFQDLDHFKQASYEYELRHQVAASHDESRNAFLRLHDEDGLLETAYGPHGAFLIEQNLKHALSPDGPDEGYSTYFLPGTEDGFLEEDVNWSWRTEEAAKWWREHPHALAGL